MVRNLKSRGWEVFAIGRDAGDFADPDVADASLKNLPKVNRIFHLITRQRTGSVQYGIQGELLSINARIHLNVLDAWRLNQPQAKLVSTGSSCVYPERDRPISETAFQTGAMHESVRGYGLAKQVLAVGSETYSSQYGLTYLHCLLATVYGPGDHHSADRTHFMGGMIDRAVREMQEGARCFTVWGEPGTVRDLLYVDDQIDAILSADNVFENERLNVSSNAPVTIHDCAKAILDSLGWEVEVRYPSGTFRGASYKTIDATRFLVATGWKPSISLDRGISEVLKRDYELLINE
jgi:GDP-L-fucose synthase